MAPVFEFRENSFTTKILETSNRLNISFLTSNVQCKHHYQHEPIIIQSHPHIFLPQQCKANLFNHVLTATRSHYSVPMMDHFAFSRPTTKIFVLDINGRQEKIFVDRLQLALIENHPLLVLPLPPSQTQKQHSLFLPITCHKMRLLPWLSTRPQPPTISEAEDNVDFPYVSILNMFTQWRSTPLFIAGKGRYGDH